MRECSLCKGAFDFNYGLKGKDADKTGLMVVLHRADARIHEYLEGYWGALINSATGSVLDKMLKRAGLDFPDVYLTNFFKCLLLGDRLPTGPEYWNCRGVFHEQVEKFRPRGIVVFGNPAYETLFIGEPRIRIQDQRAELVYQGVPTLISIHPFYI